MDGSQPAKVDRLGVSLDSVHEPLKLFRSIYLHGGADPPCNTNVITMRSTVIPSLQPFDVNLTTWGDTKFLTELIFRFPVYVSSRCLCEYRRSVSNSSWDRGVADGSDKLNELRYLQCLGELLNASEAVDPEMRREFDDRLQPAP
jgi:hypothetical protein